MAGPSRGPKSIEEIVKEASDFDHGRNYPLNMALRTAQNMLQQAVNYERDGNLQDAYFFLYRHADFFFAQISKHPDARNPQFKAQMQRVRGEVKADLSRMEALKPEIKRRADRYQDALRRREQQKARTEKTDGSDEDDAFERHPAESLVLNAEEHNDLALHLANRELRRRRRRGTAQDDAVLVDDLSRGIQDIGRRLDTPKSSYTSADNSLSSTYHYPSVPPTRDSQTPTSPHHVPMIPALPPKTAMTSPPPPPPPPPPPSLPPKSFSQPPPVPSKPSSPSAPAPPPKHSHAEEQTYQFRPAAYTENGTPLRTLFLPTALRRSFLSLSSKNTRSNLETCGILCGTLISSALFISHLVIPDQTSTSDTCETTDTGENDLFDYVDKNELMVCGWIHTHPTQTCFLSSRDLHTSVGYQVMLPESVAIVCAPSKHPDHGIFRLTDPPGKDAILNCNKPGIFHPHDQSNLYTDALRPGHVSELEGLQFQVVDLRMNK